MDELILYADHKLVLKIVKSVLGELDFGMKESEAGNIKTVSAKNIKIEIENSERCILRFDSVEEKVLKEIILRLRKYLPRQPWDEDFRSYFLLYLKNSKKLILELIGIYCISMLLMLSVYIFYGGAIGFFVLLVFLLIFILLPMALISKMEYETNKRLWSVEDKGVSNF